jgi:predicted naringenin-chalcone synthase
MLSSEVFLHSLRLGLTRYQASQADTLRFLSEIHTLGKSPEERPELIKKFVARYGVGQSRIQKRHFECEDFHLAPESRVIYKVDVSHPSGKGIDDRVQYFQKRALEVFQSFFEKEPPPEHLLHVTCTGYRSPSAAQCLVSDRKWDTEVTHLYHMGCYASMPALRTARALLSRNQVIDVVHTEMCSLHIDPQIHTPEQIVVQSLFADGHCHYKISSQPSGASFRVLSIQEKVLPESQSDMIWAPAPNGMAMNLSREVPAKIQEQIRSFLEKLLSGAGFETSRVLKEGLFAIHPGGPKIVEMVSERLELKPHQFEASLDVLKSRGNMSSATLPHIWHRILSQNPKPKTPVVSLAFGPGLTMFGSVFETV